MQEVLDLGFVVPTHSQAQRAKESVWGTAHMLAATYLRCNDTVGQGQLKPVPPEAIDLEDSEDDVVVRSLPDSM